MFGKKRKNKFLIKLISGVLLTTVTAQVGFAFPSVLDDVPAKQILNLKSTAGMFSGEDVKRSFKLLNYIGAIAEEEKNFEENAVVSRAYAVSVFAAMSAGVRGSSVNESFADVSTEHEYAPGIYQAKQMGILDESQSRFYPNKNVSYEDIAEWSLKVLDYDAFLTGKQPMSVAEEIGIFKGIKRESNTVTAGQFMKILENVLNANIVKLHMSGEAAAYEVSEKDTFLSKRYNIYLQEGIVTGYMHSSIYGDADLEPGVVEINRATYKIDEEIPVDYVGCSIYAYIDGDEENKIITLWQDERKNTVYELEKTNYESFDQYQIISADSKKIKLDENIRMVKNNLFSGYFDSTDVRTLPETDKIVVIDNNGDGKGDIIKLYKYTHYFIRSISKTSESIVLENDAGVLDLSGSCITEFIFSGKTVDPFSELKAEDVLTVLEGVRADGKKIFSAEISRDIAEGKITGKATDDVGMYYEIEGEKYYLSETLKNYMDAKSSHKNMGVYIKAYIGTDNRIAYIKSEEDFSYAYVMDAKYDDETEKATITVYTLGGSVEKHILEEKVKVYNGQNIDGVKKEAYAAYCEFLSDGMVKNEAIAYKTNAEGLITQVAFAIDRRAYQHGTLSYPLTLDYYHVPGKADNNNGPDVAIDKNRLGAEDNRVYRQVLVTKYAMGSSVPVFMVPSLREQMKNEKLYSIASGSYFGVDYYFKEGEEIKAYNVDKFYIPQFYVIGKETAKNISQGVGRTHIYIIDKISSVYNEEDEVAEKVISYYDNGTYKTVPIEEDMDFAQQGVFTSVDSVDDLQAGDIIQIHTNVLGKIDVMTVYFRAKDFENTDRGMYYYDNKLSTSVIKEKDLSAAMPNLGLIYGKVMDAKGNRVLLEIESGKVQPVQVAGTDYGAAYFVLYNTKTKTSTPASFTDIQPNDMVVMRRYYNHVQDVVIIR